VGMGSALMVSSASPRRETIGNYEIVRKLATGGMGEVFLAKQTGPVNFSRQVVLKRLHAKFTSEPAFVAMFLNEARIAANLTHPNIIHIYELFEDHGGYVIAMEYARGGTVLSLLRGRQHLGFQGLPFGPMIRIGAAVCDALYYAYNEPNADGVPSHVIHRDVSPSNVVIGYDGHVKLVDFGIAKVLDMDNVTQATTIKGKYGYLTPEQIKCNPLDQRSDIFSLGTMLWEMSTGRRLFQRANEMQMMYAILEERIPLPSEGTPDYPKDLERVVMKALARSRDDRYADASLLAQDLRGLARANGWDMEAGALSALVKDVVPEDQIAFGRIGSDSFTGAAIRRETKDGWSDDDSFASLVVIDPERPTTAGSLRSGPVEQPKPKKHSSLVTWVTILIMLALSAVFWIVIVPTL
jgi:eukaryotic-like serine/threonine-protein kinase